MSGRRYCSACIMGVEVALALMLVVGAGLLAASLLRLYRSGTGFDPRGVQNIAFSMDQQPLKDDALTVLSTRGRRIGHQPGVRDVSFVVVSVRRTWCGMKISPGQDGPHNIDQNSVAPDISRPCAFRLLRAATSAGATAAGVEGHPEPSGGESCSRRWECRRPIRHQEGWEMTFDTK